MHSKRRGLPDICQDIRVAGQGKQLPPSPILDYRPKPHPINLAGRSSKPAAVQCHKDLPVPGCDMTLQTIQVENVYLADLAISDNRESLQD
ncbi:MAG: hypothetical protein GY696_14130 [Gammaproteobacteria bacterium]|nr:hypothetical protein [Gammaproteobacteria bacterium]